MYMASPVQSKDYVGQSSAVEMSKVLILIMSVLSVLQVKNVNQIALEITIV